MWEHCLKGLESDPFTLWRECDWVAKYRLVDEVRARHEVPPGTPEGGDGGPDVPRRRPHAWPVLQAPAARPGGADLHRPDIALAMTQPPQTTRARLRGAFVRRAKERRRDFTVDWVHLKLNDQAQRTVLLKDPFKSHDERVERLIGSL